MENEAVMIIPFLGTSLVGCANDSLDTDLENGGEQPDKDA